MRSKAPQVTKLVFFLVTEGDSRGNCYRRQMAFQAALTGATGLVTELPSYRSITQV